MRNARTLALRSRTRSPLPATTPAQPAAAPAVPERLRDVGRRHVEATLAEVAPTIRRLRHVLTALVVCIPLAVVGGLVLLWRLG